MLELILITAVLLGIAFIGIGIKMFVIKGGAFKKQCSSTDPNTGERIGCNCEGKKGSCENK